MRNLNHDAGSIAVLSDFSPTVTHIFKHMQCIIYQFVALTAMDIYYHSDTAGIVFVVSLIEPLGILITYSHIYLLENDELFNFGANIFQFVRITIILLSLFSKFLIN